MDLFVGQPFKGPQPKYSAPHEAKPTPATVLTPLAKSASPRPGPGFSEGATRSVGVDLETGEVQDGAGARLDRWADQATARRLLGSEHRVATCLRRPVPVSKGSTGEGVPVYRRDTSATYYGGLQVCGSAWICPCCAAKISERRRAEVQEAIRRHTAAGGEVLLMTMTVPHSRKDAALELVDAACKALRSFWAGKGRRLAFDGAGLVGSVRALEVTHSEGAGWHPHYHALLFVAGGLDIAALAALERRLFKHWAGRVAAAGLGEASPDAFTLQGGALAAKYIAKGSGWGIADELTKANLKQARGGGRRSPFALLRDARHGDERAGRLFVTYARAFKGRSQLQWSPGLRAYLELCQELSDEQLAQAVPELDYKLGTLTYTDWNVIVRHDLRAVVLEVARSGEWSDVQALVNRYRTPARARAPRPCLRPVKASESRSCGPPAPSLGVP